MKILLNLKNFQLIKKKKKKSGKIFNFIFFRYIHTCVSMLKHKCTQTRLFYFKIWGEYAWECEITHCLKWRYTSYNFCYRKRHTYKKREGKRIFIKMLLKMMIIVIVLVVSSNLMHCSSWCMYTLLCDPVHEKFKLLIPFSIGNILLYIWMTFYI